MFHKVIELFIKGNPRSVKANKNIVGSILIKGTSIIIGFLMVRITIAYLDQTKYGIWLTLSSFLTWFTFFEIGLGSGLKNKLAEALAKKDYGLGRKYVSTTYAILTIIVLIISAVFFPSNYFINWSKVLNTDVALSEELSSLVVIVFGFFFLRFVAKLIGTVLYADQKPAIANSFGPIGNLFALITIYVLTKTTSGSLIYLGWVLSVFPIIVLLAASFYFYKGKYRNIAPSIKYIDFRYAKSLFSLGVKFFLIQISALVLFQSSNIIIAQFFGPGEVTSYNIAYKYFGIINMLFSLIVAPFWAAYTEAWVKDDISWIKKTIRNLLKVLVVFGIIGIFLYFVSDNVFNIWIGKERMETIIIDNRLKILLLIYFLTFSFGGIYNMFINGTGKIKLQMISLLIGAVFYYPITFFFIKYTSLGISSVVIGSIIANFYSPIIAPIQYYKLINKKANGIWGK